MGAGDGGEFAVDAGDFGVEVIDEGLGCGDVVALRVGEHQVVEVLAAADAEQIGVPVRVPERQQAGMDTALQRRTMLHQMQRNRARSRSARTVGVGSQIAGTRSRRDNSASTNASIRSVLHANGANPLTFTASAISTSQPASSRVSCTTRAPSLTRSPPAPRPAPTVGPPAPAVPGLPVGPPARRLSHPRARAPAHPDDDVTNPIQHAT